MKTSLILKNRAEPRSDIEKGWQQPLPVTKGLTELSPVCGTKEVCPALLVGAALLGGEAEVVGDGAPVIAARQGDELKIGEH